MDFKKIIVTKREACHLLKIHLKDLRVFEKSSKISGDGSGYTFAEFSRLQRSVASINGVFDEEKGIWG